MNVAFFGVLGLPLAWFLGFKAGYGIQGMWGGIGIATTLQVLPLIPIYDLLLSCLWR